MRPDHRKVIQNLFRPLLQPQVGGLGADHSQIPGESPHIPADGHGVVVQNNNQVGFAAPGVVQSLIGHAAGKGAVPDNSHGAKVVAPHFIGAGRRIGGRNRSGAVPNGKGVVNAFARLREPRDSSRLTQGGKLLPAAGDDFMGIALMAHVPHHRIFRRVKNPVDGKGQLHRPQVGRQMPSGLRYGFH